MVNLIKNLSVNWLAANSVLTDEQFGIETDTNRIKFGDGTTPWNTLPYLTLTTAQVAALSLVTTPSIGTFITGSNAVLLNNLVGKQYNSYDMASGALTLTLGTSPIEGGNAYGEIIADGITTPNVLAFTAWNSTSYTNTNDVVNFWSVGYTNGVAYITWNQLP